MFEALGEWMGFPAYFSAYGAEPPPRSGAHHATIVPYGPFPAGDGGTVFLSVQNEREFGRFCELVLGDPRLAGDPRFASGPARPAVGGGAPPPREDPTAAPRQKGALLPRPEERGGGRTTRRSRYRQR